MASLPRRAVNTALLAMLSARERRIPFWPAERVERLQRKRVRAMVRHAYATVPFYRQAMDERGLRPSDFASAEDLARLPLLADAQVRRDLHRFVSTQSRSDRRQEYHTGGTLGHVAKLVYWDNAALLRQLAHWERDRAVLAGLVGRAWGQRQLYISEPGAMLLSMRGFWESQLLTPRRLAQRQSVSPSLSYDAVRERIDHVRPEVVVSLGSFADRFFRHLVDRGLSVAVPRVWLYGGDMLSPGSRELIENRFGCRVHSTYNAVETLFMGFECERGKGFHLNVDLCALRLVDPQGRTVPPGESGEVVVSNLVNPATVLLNYRLGDRAVMAAAPCACGRPLPLLERFEGKTTDLIQLPDGREVSTLALESRMARALDATLQHQVVIVAPDRLLLRVVPFTTTDRAAVLRAFEQLTQKLFGPGMRVDVELVDEIVPTPAGKLRRVVPFPGSLIH